jgi:predicted Rossmann fold nucleotide-binding protein DprA/Smf involved in DNA uptake
MNQDNLPPYSSPTEEQLCLLGFNHVKGIGAARVQTLLTAFGSAAHAWQAQPSELRQLGLSEKIVEHFTEVRRRFPCLKFGINWQSKGFM